MDQEQAILKYQKLHNFFVKSLKFFNLDFFTNSKGFRVQNLFFITFMLFSYYFNIQKVFETYGVVAKIVWTYNLCWFIIHFMVIAKIFTFIYNKEQFLTLLEEIGELYSKQYSKLVLLIQQRNLQENFRVTIIVLVVYAAVFFLSEFLAIAYVMSLDGVTFPVMYELPVCPDLPALQYSINMIVQFFIFLFVLLVLAFGDYFVILFGLHFRCELRTIAEISETCLNDSDVVENEVLLLKEVYEKHLKVLKMLETLDAIYRDFLFSQILASFVCCCFLFYGTLVQEEFEGTFYMLIMLTVGELFILCLFGETLGANTEQIGTSIYLTKWYEMSVAEQMNLLFIMRIAQKPHGIKAAGLIRVNFFTFVEVLRGAASYCVILYTLTT